MKDPYGKKALDRIELKLLRDLIPFGIWNSIIEQYEDQWLDKRISNAKFDKEKYRKNYDDIDWSK